MAAPIPWFRWFPEDFARDTRHLTMLERGAYRDLLDHYYARDGFLPADRAVLNRLCGAMTAEEQAAVDKIASEYFEDDKGQLRNARADIELQDRRDTMNLRDSRAKAGAAARWAKNASSNARSNASSNATSNAKGNASNPCLSNAHITTNNKTLKEEHPGPVGPSPSGPIFGEGLSLLVNSGIAEKDARRFLGSLLASWNESDVASALLAAEGKAEPRGYVRKILNTKPKRPRVPEGVDGVLAELRKRYGSAVRLREDGLSFYDSASGRSWGLDGTARAVI